MEEEGKQQPIIEEYPVIAGVPTLVLKCGQITNKTSTLALIIPGNPGVADYYREYMSALHGHSQGALPVWCIGHAGHGRLPEHVRTTDTTEDLYGLQGQIRHKIIFVTQHMPSDVTLFLIGHSIGAYMILHMLEKLDANRVTKCYMLFPTVERMALSPKGKSSTPFLRYFRWMVKPTMFFPHYFVPHFLKQGVLQWYFQGKCDDAVEATLKIADPGSLGIIMNMAHEEMQTVVNADHHIIDKHKSKLFWYYGQSDHWCPVEYYEDMKNKHPDMDIVLCKAGYDHAFVLTASTPMAELTWSWLQKLIAY